MQQTLEDPRATVIKNVSEQQQLIDEVLKQIPSIENITFDILIQVFQRCSDIRQQPEFIEAIFSKNEVYEEFVLWILDPCRLIAKRQSQGEEQPEGDWRRRYPNACMRIAKDNNLFYIHLYLKAYFDEKALYLWFQFLKQINTETFYTSMGYFTQIMMPFLKYEFSECTQICEELMESCDEDVLMSSSVLQRQQTPVSKQRLIMSNKKKQNKIQNQISILALFPDELVEFIFNYIEHEQIFKFIHNLILVSLEQTDLKRSKKMFQAFLNKALQTERGEMKGNIVAWLDKSPMIDVCNEYVLEILKEIYDNANTQKNYRVIFFIDSFVRINITNIFMQRIQQSPLMVKENVDQKLTASSDFTSIMVEQQVLEYYIKSLTLLVKIYSKMTKNRKTEEQKERQSKYYGVKEIEDEDETTGENKVMKEFSSQINEIFTKLPDLSLLVKKNQSRFIPFSSGQNIKPISLCKYEFFELLYNCLVLSKQFPDSFVLDTEKINIFSIIERYLQQNRWNNIAHKVLEKIACLLIVNNKNFFRTKEMNSNNMADEFLNTIIESFTNKKHIFLKSLRFTTQGNLHILFTIAKAIISKLKETYNLANFVHQLDYYKKFVMNDLQDYEKKIKDVKYPADEEDMIIDNKNAEDNDQIKLYVDQLSVSQIVKKIDVVSKWPQKQNKRKHGSFIHRSLSYMSDQHQTHSSILQRRKRPPPPSQQILNTDDEEDPDDSFNKLKIVTQSPRNHSKSQNRDFSKTAEQSSGFFKNHIKKNEPILSPSGSPSGYKKNGKGLFGMKRDLLLKEKHSLNLFHDHFLSHDDSDQQLSGKRQRQNPLFCSVQNNMHVKQMVEEKKSSLKDVEETEDFLKAFNSDSGEVIKIHIKTPDQRIKKNTSIDDKAEDIQQEENDVRDEKEDKEEKEVQSDLVKKLDFKDIQGGLI